MEHELVRWCFCKKITIEEKLLRLAMAIMIGIPYRVIPCWIVPRIDVDIFFNECKKVFDI